MKGNVVGQGGIPRPGDNTALSNSLVGTTLKLLPPSGVYDGIDDTVNLANVFTTLGAKRFATGTWTFSSAGSKLTITGFGFMPSMVVLYTISTGASDYNMAVMIRSQELRFYQSGNNFSGRMFNLLSNTNGNSAGYIQTLSDGNSSGLTNDGFVYSPSTTVNLGANTQIRWFAFE